MPEFRPPLTPAEVAQRRGRISRIDLQTYREYLMSIQTGHAGYLYLGESERKPTIKLRVSLAASVLNKKIKYLRSDENEVLFEVLPSE